MSSQSSSRKSALKPTGTHTAAHAGAQKTETGAARHSKIYPINLADFFRGARAKQSSGESQWDILKWVYEVADHYGIRVRSEERVEVPVPTPIATPAAPPTPPPEIQLIEKPAPASGEKSDVTSGAEKKAQELISENKEKGTLVVIPTERGHLVTGRSIPGSRALGKKEKPKVVPVTFRRARDGKSYMVLEQLLDPEFDPRNKPAAKDSREVQPGEITRVILSCDRYNVKAKVVLCTECNGVVIDARIWTPLAIPPRAFNFRYNARAVNEFLGKDLFDIIPIPDGTVVTLYPWDSGAPPQRLSRSGLWALASSNGYDVSTLKWMGPYPYAEIFYRVAEQYPDFISQVKMTIIGGKGEPGPFLHCDNLDRTKCYSVGFRHHNFHPMTWDPMRMWQIQYTTIGDDVLTTYNDDEGGLPGIPWQSTVSPSTLTEDGQPIPLTLERLRELCLPAIRDAKRLAAEATAVAAQKPNYGFILRSKDPTITGEHSDFLVESPLLRKIRRILYQRPSRAIRNDLNHEVRLEYNIIRTFLTAVEREDCVALFPGWKAKFNAYEEFVSNVVHNIIHMHRQAAMGSASREPVPKSPTTVVAKALLAHITRYESLGAFHRDTESIIRDYVTNPEYALLYLRAMKGRPTH